MKLYADVTNGCHENGDDDFVTEYVDEQLFIDSLPTMKDADYLCCENVSAETYAQINAEYGIHIL